MRQLTFLVSVSIAALIIDGSPSQAQQSLPTIDIGAGRRTTPSPRTSPGNAPPSDAATSTGTFTTSTEPKNPTEGYVVRDASTALKSDVPIRQTPVSVVVVPKQVIRDQAITTLQAAVENVSSVRSINDAIGGYLYKIRGFYSFDLFRNQLSTGSGNGGAQFSGADTANVERIEVLKGPASIMFGRVEPGGLINIVTKQPLFTPRYVVEQQIGNYDHYRTQWDFSAPVKDVPGLAWRVSGAWQDSRVFRDFDHGSRVLVAPVVTYQPTRWTEFTVDLQYFTNRARVLTGIPTLGSEPLPLPIRRSFQEPTDPRALSESLIASYLFRQNLNEDWKITNRFLYSRTNFQQNLTTPLSLADNGVMDRFVQGAGLNSTGYSTNINLEGKFTTFGAKHNFLFGLDYLNTLLDNYFNGGAGVFPINVYDPIYGTLPPWAYLDGLAGAGFKFHSSNLTRQKGMYVQDQINFLADKAHLLMGVRYDVADVTSGVLCCPNDFSPSKQGAILERLRSPTRQDTGWSPRFGIVYDVTPEISVYGSYTRSFGPSNSTTGQIFPPQRGVQWEVGAKTEFLPGLSANLAIFQLTRSNLTTANLATPDLTDTTLAGLQRSRGIELDVLGRVSDRVTIIANYAHLDAKVIADAPKDPLDPFAGGLLGNHLDNVPRHSGKIFATYDFGDNGLGWRVGGGLTASTQAWGDIQNTFVIPGWARLDGFASYSALYEGHRLTAQLNLNNITNKRYFTGTDSLFNVAPRLSAYPAQPFNVVGTLKFEW